MAATMGLSAEMASLLSNDADKHAESEALVACDAMFALNHLKDAVYFAAMEGKHSTRSGLPALTADARNEVVDALADAGYAVDASWGSATTTFTLKW